MAIIQCLNLGNYLDVQCRCKILRRSFGCTIHPRSFRSLHLRWIWSRYQCLLDEEGADMAHSRNFQHTVFRRQWIAFLRSSTLYRQPWTVASSFPLRRRSHFCVVNSVLALFGWYSLGSTMDEHPRESYCCSKNGWKQNRCSQQGLSLLALW
jgi:hypothetical protein